MSYPVNKMEYLDSYNFASRRQNQVSANEGQNDEDYDAAYGDPNSDNYEDNLGMQDSYETSPSMDSSDQATSLRDEQVRIKDLLDLLKKNKDLSREQRQSLTQNLLKLQKKLGQVDTIHSPTEKANYLNALDGGIALAEAEIFGQSSQVATGDNFMEVDGSDIKGELDNSPDLLRNDLQELKQGIEANSDLPQDEKDAKLEQIGKWLSALDLKPSDESLQTIREGMETLKLGGDPTNSEESNLDDSDQPPTRVEKGVRYFEPTDGEDVNLSPSGKGTTNVVSTNGNLTITPTDRKAPVEISQDGDDTVITVKGDKEDVFKVKSNVSNIQINGDNVTGDYENADGKVTVGEKGEKFISPKKYDDSAATLRSAESLIGADFETYHDDDVNVSDYQGSYDSTSASNENDPSTGKPKWKYSSDTEDKNKDVRSALEKMAKAIEAKDPKEKADLWDNALTEINNWNNVNQGDLGTANDRFALLSRVIRGEFGDKGFKELLQQGIIPRDFAMKVNEGLLTVQGEIYDKTDAERGLGGSGDWNHKTYAYFWDKNSQPKVSE